MRSACYKKCTVQYRLQLTHTRSKVVRNGDEPLHKTHAYNQVYLFSAAAVAAVAVLCIIVWMFNGHDPLAS